MGTRFVVTYADGHRYTGSVKNVINPTWPKSPETRRKPPGEEIELAWVMEVLPEASTRRCRRYLRVLHALGIVSTGMLRGIPRTVLIEEGIRGTHADAILARTPGNP